MPVNLLPTALSTKVLCVNRPVNVLLLHSLKILEYHRYYRLFVIALQRNNDEDDDYAAPNTEIDEVGILISTFSNLFK